MDYLIVYKTGREIVVEDVVDSFKGDGLIILEHQEGRSFYNIDVIECVEPYRNTKESDK